jgi:hypothetical protein
MMVASGLPPVLRHLPVHKMYQLRFAESFSHHVNLECVGVFYLSRFSDKISAAIDPICQQGSNSQKTEATLRVRQIAYWPH